MWWHVGGMGGMSDAVGGVIGEYMGGFDEHNGI